MTTANWASGDFQVCEPTNKYLRMSQAQGHASLPYDALVLSYCVTIYTHVPISDHIPTRQLLRTLLDTRSGNSSQGHRAFTASCEKVKKKIVLLRSQMCNTYWNRLTIRNKTVGWVNIYIFI